MRFLFISNAKVWKKALKKFGFDENEPYPQTFGHMWHTKDRDGLHFCLITVNPQDCNRNEICAIIFHELLHCWQEAIEHIGEEAPGAEIEAHMLQMWANEAMSFYEKHVGWPK